MDSSMSDLYELSVGLRTTAVLDVREKASPQSSFPNDITDATSEEEVS